MHQLKLYITFYYWQFHASSMDAIIRQNDFITTLKHINLNYTLDIIQYNESTEIFEEESISTVPLWASQEKVMLPRVR